MSGENTRNYSEQGGSRQVFGGAVAFGGANIPVTATITPTIGSPSDAAAVAITLKDGLGNAIAARHAVLAYLANDANGDTIEAATSSLSVVAGSNGAVVELSTDNGFLLISEADGTIDLVITDTVAGSNTVYLVLVMPTGGLVVSSAITLGP